MASRRPLGLEPPPPPATSASTALASGSGGKTGLHSEARGPPRVTATYSILRLRRRASGPGQTPNGQPPPTQT